MNKKIREARDVATRHQIKIAKDTLKMSDAGVMIMGGMDKEEARRVLKKAGYSDSQIRAMEENVKDKDVIEIKKEVTIGDYVLEAGDKIRVLGEAVKEEDLIKAIKRALRNSLEVEEIDYIGESVFGHGYDFEGDRGSNGESEWCVFLEYEDAENEAFEMVENDLESEPEIFNKSFLENHLYITETDKRIIANEEADFRVEDMDEEEVFEELGDDNLKNQYDEAIENDDYNKAEEALEEAKDQLRMQIVDQMKENLEDPVEYFVEEQGIYTMEEFMRQPFVQINIREAAEEAVNIDGIAHFLDRYDGEEEEIDDPQTGDTFYAYGTN